MQSERRKSTSSGLTALRGRRIRTVVVVLVALALVLVGSWFLLRAALGTEYPLISVSSGSMCVLQAGCDGFLHPFERSLHRGDLVAVQSIDARDVQSAYPNSDVIVFHTPRQDASQEDGFSISRVVGKEEIDGVVYFRTKSDGQGTHVWPEVPDVKEFDYWFDYRVNYTKSGMISEELLVGKVVFRLPWVGYSVSLLFSSSSLFVVIAFVAVLVVATFAYSRFRGRGKAIEAKSNSASVSDTRCFIKGI